MKPKTTVEKKPPIKPSQVFFGESCRRIRRKKERWNQIRVVISHQHIQKVQDTIFLYIYLDEWSSSKEEPKQIGHDVITDHNRDRDDEPETRGFQDNDQQEHMQQGLPESLMKNRSNVGG